MTSFRIQFPPYPFPSVTDTSPLAVPAAAAIASDPPALARGISERIVHPLFGREGSPVRGIGPPRYFQNTTVVDAQRLAGALLPHCVRTNELVTRLFPRDRETLMAWIGTWPAEYRLAFFVVLPMIWDDRKKAVQDNVGDDLFGPVANLEGPDDFVRGLLARFDAAQSWLDSFHRPMTRGQGWRRCVATCRDARDFHADFRATAQGELAFEHAGRTLIVARAAVQKMQAWASKFSDGWRLETVGAFAGERARWQGRDVAVVRDFVPAEGINGDPTLGPGIAYPSAVIVGNDPATPYLIQRLQEYLRKGTRTAESPLPLRFHFHSHPLAYDRPSVEDLSIMRGDGIEMMYSPARRGLVAWADAGSRPLPRDYYARPFEELEGLGFFKTVATV